MLTGEELDRVRVVLVRARNPNNIGAVARAMHDFGFRRMRVFNEFPVPFEKARSAVDASGVLADAVICSTLAEAVGDCTLVVGTTAVGERNLRHDLLPLSEAASRLRAELRRGDGQGHVALLFGSEKTGLSNDELSHCNWLLTVPMREYAGVRHPSMNLGQAVAVCLYELVRDEWVGDDLASAVPTGAGVGLIPSNESNPVPRPVSLTRPPTTAAELERLTALLGDVLEKAGYTRRHPASGDPALVRRIVLRMGVDAENMPVWMGILRQVLWRLGDTGAPEE